MSVKKPTLATRVALRKQHIKTQRGKCIYCLGPVKETRRKRTDLSATLEHIHPRCYGGKNSLENTAVAHHICNFVRGNNRLTFKQALNVIRMKRLDGIKAVYKNYEPVIYLGVLNVLYCRS